MYVPEYELPGGTLIHLDHLQYNICLKYRNSVITHREPCLRLFATYPEHFETLVVLQPLADEKRALPADAVVAGVDLHQRGVGL